MRLSNIYSFGLLVWYVANGGTNPFEALIGVPAPFDGKAELETIRSLK